LEVLFAAEGLSDSFHNGWTALIAGKKELEYVLKSFGEYADGIDMREQGYGSREGGSMGIGSISAASLSQYVLSSSNSSQLQLSLQALQESLASGDLNGAQSAFQTVQKLNQSLATVSGSASSSSQLTTDLTALGSALRSGDLSTAQSAFATVQSDLKNSNSPSQTIEGDAASQSEQLVAGLLSTLNVNSPTASNADSTTSVLEQVYGNRSILNVTA